MTTFRNKIALVTGGAHGIGKLLCEKCLREGIAELVIWDINKETLAETVTELSAKGYKNVHPFLVDVTDVQSIEKAATEVLLEVGNVDLLFNNAGIVIGKKFRDHTARDIDMTLGVNVAGVMHVTRVFLPDMMRQGSGHIVNISSASAFIGNPKMSVYASSKWAVLGWSESLRLELEKEPGDLKVSTICPSYITTGMFDGVKAPFLFPLLTPEGISTRIIKAIKRDEIMVLEPLSVNLVPILKGVLPVRVFDFLADKLGVYHSMKAFKGHTEETSSKRAADKKQQR
ncbi:MAG: SDR family oxidoreductase [Bacteroidetes bacterium]|nr:SDR family oxidoreductase [Bacteroidota bacterium]